MLEHSIYSLISPEGCASILWRSADQTQAAAAALKLTAEDLLELGIIDEVVSEPLGGAHRSPDEAISNLGDALQIALKEQLPIDGGTLRARRREKFMEMGKNGLS
jgi:acetyl-CoA carboxylase carboxyl transferase subunit alpha